MTRSWIFLRAVPSALAVAVALSLAACGGSAPPPPPPLAPPAPKPVVAPAQPAPLGTAEKVVEWTYNPGKARDPFQRLIKIKQVAKKIDPAKLTPLQRFEIGALRLDAIMIMGKKSAAQVIAPDSKAYTLRMGTLVGPNGARVKRITTDAVILVEDYEDFLGRKLQQETVMPLHKKEGESQP